MSPSPLQQLQTASIRAKVPACVISLGLALVINLLLFLAIQQLVQPKHINFELPDKIMLVEFIRLKKDQKEAPAKRDELPDKPKPPKELPPKLVQQKPDKPEPDKIKPPVPKINVPLNLAGGPHLGEFKESDIPSSIEDYTEVAPADSYAPEIERDVVPKYCPKPKYPPRAMRAGIEGSVTVEITITSDGKVIDPVIIKSNPPKIFDRAVLKAIKKCEFEPKFSNGSPVSRRARQSINFKLN